MTAIKKFDISERDSEWHALITPCCAGSFEQQAADVENQLAAMLDSTGGVAVMRRYFLSDAANQEPLLATQVPGVWGAVEQAPLEGHKIAMWVWAVENAVLQPDGFCHGGRMHHLVAACNRGHVPPHVATHDMLLALDGSLDTLGGSLLGNCVRTWFFVHDVDVNYGGVVSGRNEAFDGCGLTVDTRFIASTGICGRRADHNVKVSMDAYSVVPLAGGQMRQISAPAFLNPTAEYGVAFERATSVDYGDRRHLFVSGTASIDAHGAIVHPGDIEGQMRRMWANVEALLAEAGCSDADLAHILVYLRDPSDYRTVSEMTKKRFPDTPQIVLLAPVCRPGWLVEMECMAVKAIESRYEPF